MFQRGVLNSISMLTFFNDMTNIKNVVYHQINKNRTELKQLEHKNNVSTLIMLILF